MLNDKVSILNRDKTAARFSHVLHRQVGCEQCITNRLEIRIKSPTIDKQSRIVLLLALLCVALKNAKQMSGT